MRFIDKDSLEKLNIHKILDKIELHCGYGKERLKSIKPYKKGDIKLAEKEFLTISAFKEFYLGNTEKVKSIGKKIHKLKNIRKIFDYIDTEYIYDEVDFCELKIQGIIFEELEDELKSLPMELERFNLKNMSKVIDILDPQNDRLPTFYVYEHYSKKLQGIREKKKEIEEKIYKENDMVILDKLRNERLKIVLNEDREELIIRKKLMHEIKEHISIFIENIEIISELDLLMGKTKFALEYNGCHPKISNEMLFKGKSLVNIELDILLREKNKKAVPIDIELLQGSNLITGANMGGKSIALKTIAQNIILCHLGIFPIGEEVTFPIVDFIFFISDDMQNLSKGLSTFGAEIIKLKEVSIFLELGNGIIFLDEFARGTNPEEGARFARGLLKYLNTQKSISLMTTHFDKIAHEGINHYQVVGLKKVDFSKLEGVVALKKNNLNILQEHMDYRLEKTSNLAIPKYALNIGILLGMNKEFLKILKKEYEEE